MDIISTRSHVAVGVAAGGFGVFSPVLGALDGEEFFAIEGSLAIMRSVMLTCTFRFVSHRQKQQQQYNLERFRFNRRGASTPLWRVESCFLPGRRPNPSYPAHCRQDTTSPWRGNIFC